MTRIGGLNIQLSKTSFGFHPSFNSMLKDKRRNLYVPNISEIDNKIDDDDHDHDDMSCLFVCIVLCVQSVKC
jgi:hypothetical protein